MSHNYGDTILLNPSSAHSDMDEIESLMYNAPSATVLPAAALPYVRLHPISSCPLQASSKPPLPSSSIPIFVLQPPTAAPPASISMAISSDGFGGPPNTLTEPVWDTAKRDLARIVTNLKLVVFPNPYHEDLGKTLRTGTRGALSSSSSSLASPSPGPPL